LSAALASPPGNVTGLSKNGHRRQEYLAFLKHLTRSYPDGELHLVMDNYAAHKRVEIRTWQAANPRIHVRFRPTSGSWLNLVEVWFGIIERQAIHRGTFRSVRDLMLTIRQSKAGTNRKHPFYLDEDRRGHPWTESTVRRFQRRATSTTATLRYVACVSVQNRARPPLDVSRDVSGAT
jgi:hypothetical protein